MKKIFMLIAFSSLLFAESKFSGDAQIGAGIINVNGENKLALKLSFSPEFKISKLTLGAKIGAYVGDGIPLDINGDGNENIKDMDFGLKFVDWDGDLFKFRYGTFNDFTLGQGTLVYNYSNNEKTSLKLGIQDKENKIGALVFFPLKKDIFGAEIDEKDQPKAMGGRIFVRPLKYMDINTPIVKNIELGLTYTEDVRDTYNKINLDGSFETKLVGSNKILIEYPGSVKGVAYELSMPIIENVLIPYYNLVQLEGKRDIIENSSAGKKTNEVSGNFVGVMGKLSVFNYKIEYRNIDCGLTPGYFGRLYEVKYNQNLERVLYAPNEKINGYFGEFGANFGGVVNLSASYEDYDKDDIKPHVFSQVEVALNKKIQGKIIYDQINLGSNLHKDKFLNEDTVIKANFVAPAAMIGIPGPVLANVNIEQTYSYNESQHKYMPSRAYTVGLSLYW